MHRRLIVFLFCIIGCNAAPAREVFEWDLWRPLPIQNSGRQKPLDSLARESLRYIANRGTFSTPNTNQQLDATALYLSMLFEWRGWEHPELAQLELTTDWRPFYFHLHTADAWDRVPLLPVDFLPLRSALGLTRGQKHISPLQLHDARIEDQRTQRTLPFSAWANKLLDLEEDGAVLSDLERKAIELADRLWSYENHRMARSLEILPIPASDKQKWMSVAHLLLGNRDYSSGDLREIQQLFVEARQSFLDGDARTFNSVSRQLVTTIQQLGSRDRHYPTQRAMAWEVAYNKWSPFRIGWILTLLAAVGMLSYWISHSAKFYTGGLLTYLAALLAVIVGFMMRIAISGRPPVTNMYESVIYVGAGVMVFGLILEVIYRVKFILSAAAAVATVALIVADIFPVVLDPSVRPLEPVLRSNFWLMTHVMTITLSYAALALALGIANITLGYYLIRSDNWDTIGQLSRITYKALQAGVLLLCAGVILGGVWADYSWGRFWGWDPKEVWALVALLGYLSVLHARFAGWVGHRGLAALSVACFSLVIMAWYGVNFVLGAGLHSYGFGGGGQVSVYVAVVLQLLYVAVSLLRSTDADEASRCDSDSQTAWSPIDKSRLSVPSS